jgi:hypothetical protein
MTNIVVNPPPNIVVKVNNTPIAIKGDTGLQGLQGIQGIQGEKGDKGDKGDKGADGAGVGTLEFEFTTPSTNWIVNHNKGYYPSVIILDIFNRVFLGEIEHVSTNQVRIYFSSSQVGKIVIN